jgi:hypothetical protein
MNTIPLLSSPHGDVIPLAINDPESVRLLFRAVGNTYGLASRVLSPLLLPMADRIAKRWLIRTNNPYLAEMHAIAAAVDTPGVYGLNLCFEWGCTSGAYQPAPAEAPRLLRILDWPFTGMGPHTVIAERSGPAGPYRDVTWPGVTGVVQAVAPGRFAAAINQAPMRRYGFGLAGDWIVNQRLVWKHDGLPALHLLRQVFETAPDYDTALRMLCETPICTPALFTLTGTLPGQGAVVERTEKRFAVRALAKDRVTIANDFLTDVGRDHPVWWGRPVVCAARQAQSEQADLATLLRDDLGGLQYPMLNECTRLVMLADAASGTLRVQGWEKLVAVTAVTAV